MKQISLDDVRHELCLFVKTSIVDKNIDVEPHTDFNQVGIDSLSIIELVLYLERKFKVSLPEEELIQSNFKSVDTLAMCAIKYINK